MRLLRVSLWWLGVVMAVFSAMGAGCSSRGRGNRERMPLQPELAGQAVFFEGTLLTEAELGPFRLDAPEAPFSRRLPGPGEGEPVPVRNGSFGGRGAQDVGTGFPRGPAEEGAFGGGPDRRTGGRRSGPGGAAALPRQSMTVTIRSTADSPIALRVVEVKSALGNFVPVPDRFTLQPRASQALEPMRAAYPATIDELEVLVSLRISGREETQVLKLRPRSSSGLGATR